jgi:hypothetical protein
VDILNDLLYLAVAAIFFALSFGLIGAFGRMMGNDATQASQERNS